MCPVVEVLGMTIKMYNLFVLLAAVNGIIWTTVILIKMQYKLSEILALMVSILLSFFVGARVFNLFINRQAYVSGKYNFWSLEATGFSVYGGILLTLIAMVVWFCVSKKSYLALVDKLYLPFACSFIIARIGCFLNGCCYGHYTESFIGVPVPLKKQAVLSFVLGKDAASALRVHPTQLYEIAGTLMVLVLIHLLRKHFTKEGMKAISFGIGFTLIRLFVFFFRDLPYSELVMSVIYPAFYLGLIIIGVFLLVKLRKQ